MLKNILVLEGTQQLSNAALKSIKGGFSSGGSEWSCIRTNGQGEVYTYHTDSEAVMESWSEAWASLGWATHCSSETQR